MSRPLSSCMRSMQTSLNMRVVIQLHKDFAAFQFQSLFLAKPVYYILMCSSLSGPIVGLRDHVFSPASLDLCKRCLMQVDRHAIPLQEHTSEKDMLCGQGENTPGCPRRGRAHHLAQHSRMRDKGQDIQTAEAHVHTVGCPRAGTAPKRIILSSWLLLSRPEGGSSLYMRLKKGNYISECR